jgi:hypothetical protein
MSRVFDKEGWGERGALLILKFCIQQIEVSHASSSYRSKAQLTPPTKNFLAMVE